LVQKQHYYHHHHHEKINDNNSDKRKQQPQKKRKKQLNNIRRLGAMLQIRRMVVDGSYYVDGLLLSYMADLPASIMVATTAGAIMAVVIARALDKSDYSFWLAGIFKSCKGTIFHNGITW
jgi:hypothetical protein